MSATATNASAPGGGPGAALQLNNQMHLTTPSLGAEYLRRGWRPILYRTGEKGPTYDPVARAIGLFEGPTLRPGLKLPRVPDRFDTLEQAIKFEHADIRFLTGESLARERALAIWVWSLPDSAPWWRERAQAVEAEIARRRTP